MKFYCESCEGSNILLDFENVQDQLEFHKKFAKHLPEPNGPSMLQITNLNLKKSERPKEGNWYELGDEFFAGMKMAEKDSLVIWLELTAPLNEACAS